MGRIAGVTAEETRDRLLTAAARRFSEKGYDGATIADIAKDAGLSSGAIYAHYRSKAELLAAAIKAHSSRDVAGVLAAEPDATAPDVLLTMGRSLGRRSSRHGALLMEAIIASRRDPDVARALAGVVGTQEQLFIDLLRRAQVDGQVDEAVSPEVVARFSLMIGLGSVMVRAIGLPQLDDDEWTRFMTGLVRGVRRRERRSSNEGATR